MKPFPKVISILGTLAGIFGALNSAEVLAVLPKSVGAVVAAIAVIVVALSHSLTGSGGSPENP